MSVTDVFPTSEGSFDEDLATGRMSQKYRHPEPTFSLIKEASKAPTYFTIPKFILK
jgi:hypothetical protein